MWRLADFSIQGESKQLYDPRIVQYSGKLVFMLARRVMAQTGITRAYNRFRAISDL
jgi:hypothetical protein